MIQVICLLTQYARMLRKSIKSYKDIEDSSIIHKIKKNPCFTQVLI